MEIRIAEVSQAAELTRLINAAFLVEKFFIDGDRIDAEQVRALFRKGEFLIAEENIAEENGGPAGCVYTEGRGERSYLGLLSIDPARQGSGLGSRLVAAAEDRCRAKGSRFMDLQIVNLREELPRFYQRRGYRDDGTAPFTAGIATKLPCHFVKMWKPL